MPELLSSLLVLSATFGLALLLARDRRELAIHRDALVRAEVQRSESLRLQQAEQRIAEIQRLTENTVSGGTEVVRAVHKGIAAIPFGVLEAIPATRDTSRVVRKAHDLISDTVYGTIKAVNQGIGAGVRQGLQGVSQPAPEPDRRSANSADDKSGNTGG